MLRFRLCATDQSHEETLSLCASDLVKLLFATLLVHRLVHLEQVYKEESKASSGWSGRSGWSGESCRRGDCKNREISNKEVVTCRVTLRKGFVTCRVSRAG